MTKKKLMRGNHILGEAAILAGCKFYAGYPITPQNEVAEYLSTYLFENNGVFIQAESELASINMLIGASMAGARVMTSSSSPGFSLKQEGISYLAGLELPAVIVNMVRGGPGLGNIAPAQGDYFQSTYGGGHGDYHCIVLAPASCQELCDMTLQAFDLADRYRNPVIILSDGMIGQMMEPISFPDPVDLSLLAEKKWSFNKDKNTTSHVIKSLLLDPTLLEEHNYKLMRKYYIITQNEVKIETFLIEDAEFIVVAFGTAARIAKGAIKRVRKDGIKVGLVRPKTLWPFPIFSLKKISQKIKHILVFEMNTGQMLKDVILSIGNQTSVYFYGRPGGIIPTPEEVAYQINIYYNKIAKLN